MNAFKHHKLLPLPPLDTGNFRLLSRDWTRVEPWRGRDMLLVEPGALRHLAAEAFRDVSFLLRPAHLQQLADILDAPGASANDRFVAQSLLRNAVIAAEGRLPMCQDTGTATVIAFKGEQVITGSDDEQSLAQGVFETWQANNLRYSQLAARSMFDEVNTGNNLPAQIDIQAVSGMDYRFLFIAKGGGSANKTALFQQTKAILNEPALTAFLREKIQAVGVAACPPYHWVVVIGGTSPEANLKTVKLAATGWLDALPTCGNETGTAFRDPAWEERVLAIARDTGLGAQFGGAHLLLDARVIRLPRHAGSCPMGIGLSCNADRNVQGIINRDGVFLENLERDPARFLKSRIPVELPPPAAIDLNAPMPEILRALDRHPVGTRLSLNGPLLVARDAAHARLKRILDETGSLPDYFKRHPIYYAGPAKTPPGLPSGSFGPTTAQRMDSYLEAFMQHGASLVTLAKGPRSPEAVQACQQHGGFYLGTIGGAAALIAQEHIRSCEVLDFADLGMEAIGRITVQDLPAFLICRPGGNLYADS